MLRPRAFLFDAKFVQSACLQLACDGASRGIVALVFIAKPDYQSTCSHCPCKMISAFHFLRQIVLIRANRARLLETEDH